MELTDILSGSNGSILALLLTPLIGVILVSVIRQKKISEIVTVSSAFLILIQVFFIVSRIISEKTITAFGNTFYIDSFGAIILLPISIVGFVSAMYSVNYMGRQYDNGMIDMKHITRYYQGFNIFLLTMLIVPIANNMGIMWVTLEATTLVSVLLIIENGLFLFTLTLTHGVSLIIEMGIFADILVGIVISSILLLRISRTFDSLDVGKLQNLRDD